MNKLEISQNNMINNYREYKYIFIEKFFRDLFENVRNVDFFCNNTMYSTLTNKMRALFLGTLLSFEDNPFLFTITKRELLTILKKVLVDVSKVEPKKIKIFHVYIDLHKYKRNLAENITLIFAKKRGLLKGQKSNILMETYKNWSKNNKIKIKTELELALTFIIKFGYVKNFYSFLDMFESGIFLQNLDDIKDLITKFSYNL